jgi:IclR family acetate operon transcriptional repressor
MVSMGIQSENDASVASDVKTVKSAERALAVLEQIAGAEHPLTVVELHKRTGYPRSSLHQLLRTLLAMKWVEPLGDGSVLGIGSRALLTGTTYLDRDAALPHAIRALEVIRSETQYTTHYARLDGANIIYLATREATEAHRLTSRVGRQLPAHATSLGKALLAELTDTEVRELLPAEPYAALTNRTIVSFSDLAEQLHSTRRRGYALEREENTLGIACVSVAVPYRIPATDAISCSIPSAQATDEELVRVANIMQEHALKLATVLRAEGIR